MKIQKQKQVTSETEVVKSDVVQSNKSIEKCRSYIKSAIDVLGAEAKDNDKLKDAIANLSVVYFDLK